MKNTPKTGKGEFLFNAKGNKIAKRCKECSKVITEKNKSGLCYFHLSLKHARNRTKKSVLCPRCKKNLMVKTSKRCRSCFRSRKLSAISRSRAL